MSKAAHLLFALLALAAVCALAPAAFAEDKKPEDLRIVSPKDRERILGIGKKFLDRQDPALLAVLKKGVNPFTALQIPDAPAPVTPTAPVLPTTPAVVTDQAVLELMAQTIRPTGSFAKGERRMLLSPKGLLEEGQVLKTTVQGKIYYVTVHAITSHTFTLRLNDTTLTRPFMAGSSGGAPTTRPSQAP